MIIQLKAVASQPTEKVTSDWCTFHGVKLFLIGEEEIIAYQNHAFTRLPKNSVGLEDQEYHALDLPADCTLLSIRDGNDLGYFLPLSNGAVLRIHTIGLDDQLVEQLSYYCHAESGLPYDLQVQKWCAEAEEMEENGGSW